MARLLLVEDSTDIADPLIELLQEKHTVAYAPNLAAAKEFVKSTKFDLILLDVSLPDGSGFNLCEYIKSEKICSVPVIFLTGESDLSHRMKGLELGAQDYILKPFYLKELILRIEMRLQQFEAQSNFITYEDLKFDKNLHRVWLINAPEHDLGLTPNEYKILSLLVAQKGSIVSRAQIVDTVWGPGFSLSDKAVNSHISNLRKKIQSSCCKLAVTEGKGYSIEAHPVTKD